MDEQRLTVIGQLIECGRDRCRTPAAVMVFQLTDDDDNSGPMAFYCEAHARELMGQLRAALFAPSECVNAQEGA